MTKAPMDLTFGRMGELEKIVLVQVVHDAWHVSCGVIVVQKFGNSIQASGRVTLITSTTPEYVCGYGTLCLNTL